MAYPYILAWCEMTGIADSAARLEVAIAHRDGAPPKAICRAKDGGWHTYEDIPYRFLKRRVDAIVTRMHAAMRAETRRNGRG